ncbi:hypothetical protein EDD16DRAFT_1522319 [Pisolithus croceorrhizus]|nr:hypothetical protein EDD16DRAFT_1522319 [Pisolithus croceorrhizus]
MAKPFGARLFSAWSDIVFLIHLGLECSQLNNPNFKNCPSSRAVRCAITQLEHPQEALRLLAGQSTYTLASVEQHKGAMQLNFIRVVASYNDPHHPKQATALLIAHYLIFNLRASCIQASVEWQKGSKAGGHTTHQPNFVEGAVTPLAGLVKRKVRNMSGIGSKDLSDPIGDPAEEKN